MILKDIQAGMFTYLQQILNASVKQTLQLLATNLPSITKNQDGTKGKWALFKVYLEQLI